MKWLDGITDSMDVSLISNESASDAQSTGVSALASFLPQEKGTTEDETVRWHHRLSEHEFEHTPEGSEGPRSLVSYCHGVAESWTGVSALISTLPQLGKTQLSDAGAVTPAAVVGPRHKIAFPADISPATCGS